MTLDEKIATATLNFGQKYAAERGVPAPSRLSDPIASPIADISKEVWSKYCEELRRMGIQCPPFPLFFSVAPGLAQWSDLAEFVKASVGTAYGTA